MIVDNACVERGNISVNLGRTEYFINPLNDGSSSFFQEVGSMAH